MPGMLSLDELRSAVEAGSIDTVVVAMTDMQGRLQGKRLHAQFFLDEVAEHGTEACDYLLAVDTDMNTVPGYASSSWETGYGDIALTPDMGTLRVLPWQPGTALVLADVNSVNDGSPIARRHGRSCGHNSNVLTSEDGPVTLVPNWNS